MSHLPREKRLSRISFLYAAPSQAGRSKWNISSLSRDSHHTFHSPNTDSQCVYPALGHIFSAAPDSTWETKWWREWHLVEVGKYFYFSRVEPPGFQLYQTFPQNFRILDAHDDFPAVSKERLKCKKWNSIVAQHGWWMSNSALMPQKVRSEGGSDTSHHCSLDVERCTCRWEL